MEAAIRVAPGALGEDARYPRALFGKETKAVTQADPAPVEYETDEPVLYEVADSVAWVTMSRPRYNNSQNSQMTYALDAAFRRAIDDDAVKVIVLGGAGKHFSAGHDIGTPGRDVKLSFDRVHLLPDHVKKPGAEFLYTREQEVYLGMCRRWRELQMKKWKRVWTLRVIEEANPEWRDLWDDINQ